MFGEQIRINLGQGMRVIKKLLSFANHFMLEINDNNF